MDSRDNATNAEKKCPPAAANEDTETREGSKHERSLTITAAILLIGNHNGSRLLLHNNLGANHDVIEYNYGHTSSWYSWTK